jgi:hypothetical protein
VKDAVLETGRRFHVAHLVQERAELAQVRVVRPGLRVPCQTSLKLAALPIRGLPSDLPVHQIEQVVGDHRTPLAARTRLRSCRAVKSLDFTVFSGMPRIAAMS